MRSTIGLLNLIAEKELSNLPLRKCELCGVTNRVKEGQQGWLDIDGHIICNPCYFRIADKAIRNELKLK